MTEESKHLERTEACYETEYSLRKDIHYRKGEILKLEYINAKYCREIERLSEQVSALLSPASNANTDLFEYLKALLIELSSKDGVASINPDEIDVKYIEASSRYRYPVLFDKYAVLSEDDKHKIELANSILYNFGIETMAMYERVIMDGDIDIRYIDNRPKGL